MSSKSIILWYSHAHGYPVLCLIKHWQHTALDSTRRITTRRHVKTLYIKSNNCQTLNRLRQVRDDSHVFNNVFGKYIMFNFSLNRSNFSIKFQLSHVSHRLYHVDEFIEAKCYKYASVNWVTIGSDTGLWHLRANHYLNQCWFFWPLETYLSVTLIIV